MTARIRRWAAGWLLTLMLIVTPPEPAPAGRGGTSADFSARARADVRELRAERGGIDDRPEGGTVDPVGWNEVQVSVRVSYVQSELLSPDEAQG